jgi:hypothetical protein
MTKTIFQECNTCKHHRDHMCTHPANDRVRIRDVNGTFMETKTEYHVHFARSQQGLCGKDASWHSIKRDNVDTCILMICMLIIGFIIGYWVDYVV